jgi:hypothetical protein
MVGADIPNADRLGLVLFVGYPSPRWSSLIVAVVAGVAPWLWPRRTGRSTASRRGE